MKSLSKICIGVLSLTIMLSMKSTVFGDEMKAAEISGSEVTTASSYNTTQEQTTSNEQVTTSENTSEVTTEQQTTEEQTTEQHGSPYRYGFPTDTFSLVAHRGYSGIAPMNSLQAFIMAKNWKFKTIELDIRRCKPDENGVPTWVVIHDDNFESTLGIKDKVEDLTFSQIRKYNYTKGNNISAYPGLKIMSLQELLKLISETEVTDPGILWQIEIKVSDDPETVNYLEKEVVLPCIESGCIDNIMFASFSSPYLKRIKQIDSSIPIWYFNTVLDQESIDIAHKIGAVGISFKGNKNYATEEMIEYGLSKGLNMGAYNVDTTILLGAYYNMGLRVFTTNQLSPLNLNEEIVNIQYDINNFPATLSKTSYTYNGKRKLPTVTVTHQGEPLIEGINYQLSYTDNKVPGTAAVYISGLHNTFGEHKLTYKIKMPKVNNFAITSTKTTYAKLKWDKVEDVTGYAVYSYDYSAKKYVRVKTITKNTTTSCKISKLKSATKYRFRVKAYATDTGKNYYSTASTAKTTYTRPAKVKSIKVKRTSNKKSIKITLPSKIARASGYYIQAATDKKMKNVVKTYKIKYGVVLSAQINKVSKNKDYYLRARSYYKVGKKTINGVYSPVVKCKKVKKKKSK